MPKEKKKFEYVDDVLEDIQETGVDLFNAVEELTGHIKTVAEHLAKFQPAEAVANAAQGTEGAVEATGEAVGNVERVALDTVEAPLEAVSDAATEVSNKSREFNNKLHRLKMR